MANRLGHATSPYLLQHADNPVDWWEWSAAAFAESRRRDVPILLSIGYAACHWCHVMAHESFEDETLAAQMNADFVCIKVDREERPDIDSVYMNATVAMTGQGGWPMTCFLTPDGEPFYCGTYYPPHERAGQPGLDDLLTAVARTWQQRRGEVIEAGARIAEQLRANTAAVPTAPLPDSVAIADAVSQLHTSYDAASPGFGGAPKFPPSALLEGLLRVGEFGGPADAHVMAEQICAAMAAGGIYDQLAGGFARYSVDRDWQVPHFEKMLYDNALLIRAYAHLARRTGSSLAARVTAQTVEFLDDALWTGSGYASSLDADTNGVEGATYVWTRAQLIDALGADDGDWAARVFAVTESGNFEHGASTLRLLVEPDDPARFDRIRRQLRDARSRRPQPDRDDKVVTVWNALTVTALVEAGRGLRRPEWIARAVECAEQLWRLHVATDGSVRRSSLAGKAGDAPGALEDYAALATAFFTLHETLSADQSATMWRDRGATVLDAALAAFADPETPGAWFDALPASVEDPPLLTRPRDPVDGATPSGAALLAEALLLAGLLADEADSGRYLALADDTLTRGSLILRKAPGSAGHWLAVTQARIAGPIQVAVAQTATSTGEFAAALRSAVPGGVVVVAGDTDDHPLLAGRTPVDGRDAGYICRGSVCSLPVTTLAEVLAAL